MIGNFYARTVPPSRDTYSHQTIMSPMDHTIKHEVFPVPSPDALFLASLGPPAPGLLASWAAPWLPSAQS